MYSLPLIVTLSSRTVYSVPPTVTLPSTTMYSVPPTVTLPSSVTSMNSSSTGNCKTLSVLYIQAGKVAIIFDIEFSINSTHEP